MALALAAAPGASPAPAQAPVAHAVLFYSPTCPHCHEVINTHLPPLRERYGEQFVIVGVDVTTASGSALYEAAVDYYGLAPDRLGVPLLVIGEVNLLGSQEIPQRLPGLIDAGLAAGGTPWPALPALRQALAAQGLIPEEPAAAEAPVAAQDTVDRSTAPSDAIAEDPVAGDTPTEAETAPGPASDLTTSFDAGATAELTATQRFMQDPVANAMAVVTLMVLVGALALGVLGIRGAGPRMPAAPSWVLPVLALAGVAIAAYLSQVEITGAQAVCGPVGDCNAVQQSAYARLFGVPVGVLGALGYLGILVAWFVAVAGPQGSRKQARHVVWAFALVGCAFSAYLTFLEPFVIGATCAWCVSSALIMAALVMLATGEVRRGA